MMEEENDSTIESSNNCAINILARCFHACFSRVMSVQLEQELSRLRLADDIEKEQELSPPLDKLDDIKHPIDELDATPVTTHTDIQSIAVMGGEVQEVGRL